MSLGDWDAHTVLNSISKLHYMCGMCGLVGIDSRAQHAPLSNIGFGVVGAGACLMERAEYL